MLESRISRFEMSGGVLNPASESILLTLAQPYTNHKGGNVAFGPDNLLYAGFGDGGDGGDPQNRSQDRSVLFGKIIRIDVSGGGAYAVPPGNPFTGAGTARCQTGQSSGGAICSEIYAYGFRNPWRLRPPTHAVLRRRRAIWECQARRSSRQEMRASPFSIYA